jgi:GntR family transcriptional regulator/MocR family aminotransferase
VRELTLDIPEQGAASYLRLARAIREAVREGQVRPGELLPSTRKLSQIAGVHRHTVMAALDELVAEGWIAAEAGRGYRVSPRLPVDARAVPARTTSRAWPLARDASVREAPPALPLAFPSGLPDLRLFPVDDYYGCIRDALRRLRPERLLGYSEAGGTAGLLEQLGVYLRRMRGLTDRGLVVTHGSQEAIFLLGQLLLGPGDAVAVEALGYPPAWEALRLSGARLIGVALDPEGIVPEALERILRRRAVKMLYLTPLHQYPTTVTLSAARRLAVYAICERHGVAILEDDYDHEFHFRSQPVPPMAARDPAGIVLYVSTFSKVLYPAARLGFALVPPPLVDPLRRLKQVVTRQNDTLVQEGVARWMRLGGFERHLRRMRRVYERRRETMALALREGCERHGLPLETRIPDGGMSLWVSLGVPSDRLAERAAEKGVSVRPGREYMLAPKETSWLRLGYASSSEEEIEEGTRRLVEAAVELHVAPSRRRSP